MHMVILLSSALLVFGLLDCLNILKFLDTVGIVALSRSCIILRKRLNWALNILFTLGISLFAESLVIKPTLRYRFFTGIRLVLGVCLALMFIATLFLPLDIESIIASDLSFVAYFFDVIVECCSMFIVLRVVKCNKPPRILEYQIKIFVYIFMAPQLLAKCFTYNPFTCDRFFNTHMINDLSMFLVTAAMYYCTFRLMGLRFLNTRDQVTASRKFDFVRLMRDVIVQLPSVANSAEFRHVTQQVFSKAFSLPENSVRLVLIQDENYQVADEQIKLLQKTLSSAQPVAQLLDRTKVITRDEIDFSAYYDESPAYLQAADFLRKLQADVFIPVYDRNIFLGCIIVNEGTRRNKFFSAREQDEMVLFAGSLGPIITVVRSRNIDVLLESKNSAETELYHRYREIGQYQESIRSFVRESYDNTVGILYYKYNNFTFGNEAAHDLVTCDPNVQRGHPLTIQLRKIAQNAEKYGAAQHTTICFDAEQRLTVAVFPSLEKQSTVFVVSHPTIADIIKFQSDFLNDPGQWNYLLYLETTEAGQRVRGLIPGSSRTILNFKIELLRAAISHRAVLLNAPVEDRAPVIELLQAIGHREKISTITLKEPEKDLSVARELFGFAKVLGDTEEHAPLIARLDKIGTIYLENIHFLSRETQAYLAEYLRYGAYRPIKGEQRFPSNVRVICSSSESLPELVEKGLFLPELLDELRVHQLMHPQPHKLCRQEFDELVQEYMHELLKNHALKKILILSEREVQMLYNRKYTTFFELRKRLSGLIAAKALERETVGIAAAKAIKSVDLKSDSDMIIPAYADERINQAIMLGKHALNDRELLEYLWKTFQNQSKIATLLGVNRSSVNRRLKSYHIG